MKHAPGDTALAVEILLPLELQSGLALEDALTKIATISGSSSAMTAIIGGTALEFQEAVSGNWVKKFSQTGEYTALRPADIDPHAANTLVNWRFN